MDIDRSSRSATTLSSPNTTTSSPSSQSSESETRFRKKDKPIVIGYTLPELEAKRREPFWRTARVIALILFWAVWAGLLAGSILIIVLNNGDVPKTTVAPATTTKHA